MLPIIENSLLSYFDKTLLQNMIDNHKFPNDIQNLSIISKKGIYTKNKNYNTIIFNCEIYYNNLLNVWVDNEFKLIPFSNYWYNCDITTFINHINHFVNIIKNINIDNYKFIDGKFICIQNGLIYMVIF
jgi:hypothetical protein